MKDHAFYISVVEIDRQEKGLMISVKAFEDDLRDALRLETQNIYAELIDKDSVAIIEYFRDKLIITSDCIKHELSFDAISREGDSYWIQMMYPLDISCGDIKIEATFLMEVFDTQKNILHYTDRGQKYFATLQKGRSGYVIPDA